MNIKQVFADADATQKGLAGLRADMAEIVARPMPGVAGLDGLLAEVDALQQRIPAALDPVTTDEAALKGLDRALIIANDDADIAARDRRLRSFESERLRLEILTDELAKLRERVTRKIEVEDRRPGLLKVLADYQKLLTLLANWREAADKFEQCLAAAETASGDWYFLHKRRELYPEITEIDAPFTDVTIEPAQMLERLAKRYTTLVEPKR